MLLSLSLSLSLRSCIGLFAHMIENFENKQLKWLISTYQQEWWQPPLPHFLVMRVKFQRRQFSSMLVPPQQGQLSSLVVFTLCVKFWIGWYCVWKQTVDCTYCHHQLWFSCLLSFCNKLENWPKWSLQSGFQICGQLYRVIPLSTVLKNYSS